MAKSLRSIFFDVAAAINSRGKRINFKTDGQPDEALMQNLVDSATFFKETDDRARQAAGGNVEDEVGLVTIAPDSEAKAGTSGLTASRTKVSHAAQLPTSEAESQTVDTFTGEIMDVTADAGTLTRNQYKFKWTAAFVAFINNKLLPDFVGGDATKLVRINAGGTAYELVDASTVGGGEDNTASNVGAGTGQVFKQKTGEDLELKTLAQGTFMDITNNVSDVDLAVDGAALVSSLVDPIYAKNGISIGAGSAFFKQKTAGNIEIRSATQGANAGIVLVENTNDVSFAINDSYINTLIDARVAVGSGQGNASSYLFSAVKIVEQSFGVGANVTAIISIADDSSPGNYDYDNSWLTSIFTANADIVGVDIKFTSVVEVELTQLLTATETFSCSIQFFKNGISEPSTSVVTFNDTNLVGNTLSMTLTDEQFGVMALNDTIEIKITASGSGLTTGGVKVTKNAQIWNTEP